MAGRGKKISFILIFALISAAFLASSASARGRREKVEFPFYELEEVLPESAKPAATKPAAGEAGDEAGPKTDADRPESVRGRSTPSSISEPQARQESLPGAREPSSSPAEQTPVAFRRESELTEAEKALRNRMISSMIKYAFQAENLLKESEALTDQSFGLKSSAVENSRLGREAEAVHDVKTYVKNLINLEKKAQNLWFSSELNKVTGFTDEIGLLKGYVNSIGEEVKFRKQYWKNVYSSLKKKDPDFFANAERYNKFIDQKQSLVAEGKTRVEKFLGAHPELARMVRDNMGD